MYQLVSRVGSMFGIIDTDDGAIDWLDWNTIVGLTNQGIVIQGINNGVVTPSVCCLFAKKCNWANGKNVFQCAECFTVTPSGLVRFKAGDKQYKGKIVKGDSGYFLLFTFNVAVSIHDIESISSLRFNL